MVSPGRVVKGSCGSRAMGCHDKDGIRRGCPPSCTTPPSPCKVGFRDELQENGFMYDNNQLSCVAIRIVDGTPLESREAMNSPEAAVRVVCGYLQNMDREYFCVINICSDGKPINMNVVSVGTLNYAVIHPREVFKTAILSNAAAVILLHNHPSGCLNPSVEDLEITRRLQEAGTLIGIPVVDHIISGRYGEYLSMKEQGIISENEFAKNMVAECGTEYCKETSL